MWWCACAPVPAADSHRKTKWVVYAKLPFSGPEDVLEYAARYTHRVAISNDRLLDIQDEKVQFRWKDYRDGNRMKVMTVTAEEFIRRFLLHVLPEGFQRIRHYGFLANRYREQKLARCRDLPKMPPAGAQIPKEQGLSRSV
jgi:Putative transposase